MDENRTIDQDRIIKINIEQEMKSSYIDYSMSVIVARALPDVRDGFKPVHRRILYGMAGIGNTSDKPYKKCARVVGEVLGKFHPHGDSSVYGALVRMAQDWNMRYTLVDGQGNFGSVDGDSAAAMRYTECRLSKMGEHIMDDLEKDTVDMQNNFDDSLQEPSVMPTKIPNLLVNGGNGIAVGMTAVISGLCIDFWFLLLGGNGPYESLWLRIAAFVFGAGFTSLAIAFVFRTSWPIAIYELLVREVAGRFGLNINRVKLANDVVMLLLSAVLAFALTGGFHGFGPGTILITFINAPLIAFFGRLIDRRFTFEPRFPKLTKMLSE